MGSRAYEAEGITVRFELKRCIHAEACVHGLPLVFPQIMVDILEWIHEVATKSLQLTTFP